jgi:hypothetical protein
MKHARCRLELLLILELALLALEVVVWPPAENVYYRSRVGPLELSYSATQHLLPEPFFNFRARLWWRDRPLNDLEWSSEKGWLSFP